MMKFGLRVKAIVILFLSSVSLCVFAHMDSAGTVAAHDSVLNQLVDAKSKRKKKRRSGGAATRRKAVPQKASKKKAARNTPSTSPKPAKPIGRVSGGASAPEFGSMDGEAEEYADEGEEELADEGEEGDLMEDEGEEGEEEVFEDEGEDVSEDDAAQNDEAYEEASEQEEAPEVVEDEGEGEATDEEEEYEEDYGEDEEGVEFAVDVPAARAMPVQMPSPAPMPMPNAMQINLPAPAARMPIRAQRPPQAVAPMQGQRAQVQIPLPVGAPTKAIPSAAPVRMPQMPAPVVQAGVPAGAQPPMQMPAGMQVMVPGQIPGAIPGGIPQAMPVGAPGAVQVQMPGAMPVAPLQPGVQPPAPKKKTKPAAPKPNVEDEDLAGIDTVDLDRPQGNWLFKRLWWERAEEKYEEIRMLVAHILELRLPFFLKRTEVDRTILDPFYINVAHDRGALQILLSDIGDFLTEEVSESGMLNEETKDVRAQLEAKRETLEHLQKNVHAVLQFDHELDEAIGTLMEQLHKANEYEQEAWTLFKEIGRVLDDQKAREYVLKMKHLHRTIKDIEEYIKEKFTVYFDQLIATIKENVTQVSMSMEQLTENGINLAESLNTLKEQGVEDELNGAQEENKPKAKEKGFFDRWILTPVSSLFGAIWNGFVAVISWPYNLIFGPDESFRTKKPSQIDIVIDDPKKASA